VQRAEVLPLEKWVEIGVARSAAAARGVDPAIVLQERGITSRSWQTTHRHWVKQFAMNATRGGGDLYARYVQLQAEFARRLTAPRMGQV
jgi:hypothetical protein